MNNEAPITPCALFAAQHHLPLATKDLPGTGGRLRLHVEDFEVEELPEHEPDGAGEHLYLWIEKRGVDARRFMRYLADKLMIDESDIGYAGIKDAVAVTRQYVSVPARCESSVATLDGDTIRVLRSARNSTKLRTGHLLGNRFRITIGDVHEDAYARAIAITEVLSRQGLPNYYGMQRFGHDGDTLRRGLSLIRGDTRGYKAGFMLRLMLSSVQSALFNCYLTDRLQTVGQRATEAGEVLQDVKGGWLLLATGSAEEQARLQQHQLVPTGPMFGPKMRAAQAQAAARERQVLDQAGLQLEDFSRFTKLLAGTRRPLWVWPGELEVAALPRSIELHFTLPAGSYATVLLKEIMKEDTSDCGLLESD